MGSEFPDKPLHSFRNLSKIIWLFRGNIDSKTKVFLLNICPLCVWRAIKELSNYQGLRNWEPMFINSFTRTHGFNWKRYQSCNFCAIPSNKMAFKSKERENVLSIQNCPALRHFRIRELGDI